MTRTSQKYRALFLSALMVLSVVAVTISFSGAAAAANEGDADLDSGETLWVGQVLQYNESSIVSGHGYEIRDSDGVTVRQRNAQQDDFILVDTSGLESGTYTLNWTGAADGTNTNQEFRLSVQDLETTFDPATVSEGDVADLDVESIRGTFTVSVEASGLDEEELMDIFAAATHGEETDDDVVLLPVEGGVAESANFTGISPGDYTLEFAVTDTDATSTANVSVSELDVTQDFSQNIYEEDAGDIVDITVELDDTTSTWIVVGGDESGWLAAIHVVDEDEDGEVSVQFNTYLAGQSDDVDAAFSSEDDDIDMTANATDIETGWTESGSFDGVDASTNLTEPISAGDYDLRTASTASMSDDGSLSNENDVATLVLNERSTSGATVWTAPAGAADSDELSELTAAVTESDTSRLGDRVVIAYEVSGIYGYLDTLGTDPLAELANFTTGEAVNLEVAQTNPGPNRDANVLDLEGASSGQATLVPDADNNTLYLVIDTSSVDGSERALAAGHEYAAALYVGDDGEIIAETREYANYVDDDELETAAGTFTLEATEGAFDNINADDQVQVLQDEEATATGTTNIAPGSEVNVRLRASGDSPFLKTRTVEVQSDGTWSATFDMSEVAVGQEFTATLRTGATTLAEEDAVVVDEIEEPAEGTVIVTRTVVQDTPTPRVETREVTREVEVTRTVIQERTVMVTQTTGQPGFGIAVAIVALLAAALLAVRRRD